MAAMNSYPVDPPRVDDMLTPEGEAALPGEDLTDGRPNRSSSSPSTLGDEDLPLDENDLEDSDAIIGTSRQTSVDSGQSNVYGDNDPRQSNDNETSRLLHNSDHLDVEGDKDSRQGSIENGSGRGSDAKSLGTPIIEQLLKKSSCGQIRRDDLHNNRNNVKTQFEMQQDKVDSCIDGGSGADVEDLASQLVQLQVMVKEMREGFTGAMEALSKVQYEDRILEQKVDANKAAHEQQLADIVQMVLALKCEFGGIVSQLATSNDNQQQLRAQVDHLQYERDILLEELERHGVISENVRQKYHSGKRRPNGLTRANDSSLSGLLERARSLFNSTNNGNSDQDSGVNTYHQGDNSTCGEVTPPNVSPMVQSYIAGLHTDDQEDVALEENYDSDSSLTQAANKSLDLSRSLGDTCAKLTNVQSSDEEELVSSVRNKNIEHQKKHSMDTTSPHFHRPTSPKKTPPHERNIKDHARSRVTFELLETERKYCSCLWTILDHFANPLKDGAILPAKDISILFPDCLSRIYDHHCAFLQRLEERVANWKCYGVVGDVFSNFIDNSDYDVLVQYRTYVTEFPSALNQLKKSCRQSLRFRKFLRKCQAHTICEGLDLSAFLLTPVQRIPRYVLLLKQLMKYTVPEHVDYYYVEACLAKLKTFLSQLNDSIEYSMKIVADDITPKTKRKSRVGSLRSSSNSFDGMQLTTANRDSDIQSSCDNTSLFINSLNNGRLFQSGTPKTEGSERPLYLPLERPLGVADRVLGVPDPNLSLNGNYDSRTMPSMGTRRQRERLRRPKSSDHHLQGSGDFDDSRFNEKDEHIFLMPKPLPPRPSSIASDNLSFKDQLLPGGLLPPLKSTSFNAKKPQDFRVHSPPNAASSQADMKNYTITPTKSLPVNNSRQIIVRPNHSAPPIGSGSLHKSLMHIPGHDYGIYGNESEDNSYTPSVVSDENSKRRAHKLSLRSRSQGQLAHNAGQDSYSRPTSPNASLSSTGNVITIPGASNLSQYHINMALARSMADDASRRQHQANQPNKENLDDIDASSLSASYYTTQSPFRVTEAPAYPRKLDRPRSCLLPGDASLSTSLQSDPDFARVDPQAMRPRSSSTGHKTSVAPSNSDGPDKPRDNVWDDSTTDNSMLNASDTTGGRRKDFRKKKKDKQKKDESITSEGGRRKGGFKDSLRNIFFKKRKGDKDKSMLQDVLAEDTQVRMTSLKIPLTNQDSMLNISPVKCGNDETQKKKHVPKVEVTGAENEPQIRSKKRPHSICYGSILRSPQEKKSILKSSSSLRSSLRWSLARPVTASTLATQQVSKVVEIGGGVEYRESSETENHSIAVPQVSPPKDSLIITSRTDAPDFSTYEDENGDPCSAV